MKLKLKDLMKAIVAVPDAAMQIDPDAVTREIARNLGIPKKHLRTPEQIAVFRRRSKAAKLGWKRRKRHARMLLA